MPFAGGLWKGGQPKVDPVLLYRIKERTRALLALPAEAVINANEIVCADPACPGSETVILVMMPGQRTRGYKVQAAMADVTDAMLATALGVSA